MFPQTKDKCNSKEKKVFDFYKKKKKKVFEKRGKRGWAKKWLCKSIFFFDPHQTSDTIFGQLVGAKLVRSDSELQLSFLYICIINMLSTPKVTKYLLVKLSIAVPIFAPKIALPLFTLEKKMISIKKKKRSEIYET